MQQAEKFIFTGYRVEEELSAVYFDYTVKLVDGKSMDFSESLVLPFVTLEEWRRHPREKLRPILDCLHLALGMSYWKMHCAPFIQLNGINLSAPQAEFWTTLYTKGLGEFFFRNRIDFRGLVKFPVSSHVVPTPGLRSSVTGMRCLVPVGGGKDSVVTLELIRSSGNPFDLFTLGGSKVQSETAAVAGKGILEVERHLDPKLIQLSKYGEVYNGHVPISSIYMFAGVFVALLKGYSHVVFSNERSANEGNLEYHGQEINHQWSKSLEAELLIREYIKSFVSPNVVPFSLLRPLSELDVVRRFVEYPQYLPVFSSCNRNFVVGTEQSRSERGAYWCGGCPKCAFVFAMLSAFVPKADLLKIFGKDLFADATLLQLFKDLLGRGSCKPFECVGTPDEMMVAMHRASVSGDYSGEAIMGYFENEVAPEVGDFTGMERRVLEVGDTSSIPEKFKTIL